MNQKCINCVNLLLVESLVKVLQKWHKYLRLELKKKESTKTLCFASVIILLLFETNGFFGLLDDLNIAN